MSNKRKTTIITSPSPVKKIKCEKQIKTLSDLISIIPSELPINYEYSNLDIHQLIKIKDELKELNSMIGLEDIKESILNQILYYLQNLNKYSESDYLNTVIYGAPGTGKTTIAKLLGRIFAKLGILGGQRFVIGRRDTLIAGYLGQTAIKTKELLDSACPGVLFIDEVYSLGNEEKRDSFSKECIDTINLFLSENRNRFMLIVAGYEKEIEDCFFSYNEGLKRRFMWYHKIESYASEQLSQLFILKCKKNRWYLENELKKYLKEFFTLNEKKFENFGGDIDNFFTLCKVQHSKRVFLLDSEEKRIITKEDLETSIKLFKNKDEKEKENHPHLSLYL